MRLVGSPPIKINDPIEAANPIEIVCTSGTTNCIPSYTEIPGKTDPPGQLMYKYISLAVFSALRKTIKPTS